MRHIEKYLEDLGAFLGNVDHIYNTLSRLQHCVRGKNPHGDVRDILHDQTKKADSLFSKEMLDFHLFRKNYNSSDFFDEVERRLDLCRKGSGTTSILLQWAARLEKRCDDILLLHRRLQEPERSYFDRVCRNRLPSLGIVRKKVRDVLRRDVEEFSNVLSQEQHEVLSPSLVSTLQKWLGEILNNLSYVPDILGERPHAYGSVKSKKDTSRRVSERRIDASFDEVLSLT